MVSSNLICKLEIAKQRSYEFLRNLNYQGQNVTPKGKCSPRTEDQTLNKMFIITATFRLTITFPSRFYSKRCKGIQE